MNSRNNSKIKHDTGATSASCLSELKARQSSKIRKIRQALVAAGFDTLTRQAAVLGLSRSTTWAVLRGNHKGSGLSTSVINRILRSQELPPTVRRIIEEYVQEKLFGTVIAQRAAHIWRATRSSGASAKCAQTMKNRQKSRMVVGTLRIN